MQVLHDEVLRAMWVQGYMQVLQERSFNSTLHLGVDYGYCTIGSLL
jgi:hypothetical protein